MKTKDCAILAPCPKCPFRSDVQPFITTARATSILRAVLSGQSFQCHRTTEHDDDGEHIPSSDERLCAGSLIVARKEGALYANQMVRIAERLGANFDEVYEGAPVYASARSMIAAHAAQNGKKRAAR